MSREVYLQKDVGKLGVSFVSFDNETFERICKRAARKAAEAGLTALSDDFLFAIKLRQLQLWNATDSGRVFFVSVLKDILEDSDFFSWADYGCIPCPDDPGTFIKQRGILGMEQLITVLESLVGTNQK